MLERLHRRLKLSHWRHSGRVLPRTHTSHGALLVIILAAGAMLAIATRAVIVSAADQTQSYFLSVAGTVPGPPPSEPAVILQPANGRVFNAAPATVSGTCPSSVIVEVYKNGILAGSVACSSNAFQLNINLVLGENVLLARVSDNLNQYGPDSGVVTVTYRLPGSGAALPPVTPTSPRQFVITTNSRYFGVLAGELYRLEIIIAGGMKPYAVSVDWGNGASEVVSRAGEGRFGLTHAYNSGSLYVIKINGSDSPGGKAYAQTTVLIGAAARPAGSTGRDDEPGAFADTGLEIIWPLYVSMLIVVSTFWFGEKYQLQKDKDLWKTKGAG